MTDLPPELRRLFADEAATRLTRLSEELLELEARGQDAELVASVFRDAHTLKGSAGMMGFKDFAAVAHNMEDLLAGVRSGTRAPTSALVDALLAAVDALRGGLAAAAGGATEDPALRAAAAQLAAFTDAPPVLGTEPSEPVAVAVPRTAVVAPAPVRETVRVPRARLDELSRLADEAAAVHTRLVSAMADRLGRGRALPPEADALILLLRNLQEQANRARMVPVSNILEPLRRAVRDVARSQNKDVRFEVVGEATELDRGVLDRLADPLLHLVRNAVDHGIERPEERRQAGKPPHAIVRLGAAAGRGHVVITVSDDGRGIDVERVRAAAPEAADPLDIVFQPGFSTAQRVTDVSGRGVGLDVVRSALDAVRGRVELRTEPGRGAVFVMTVPLTVAAVECLIVEVAGRPYGIPLDNVIATVPAEVGHTSMASILDTPIHRPPSATVILTDGRREHPVAVASVIAHRDLVVKGIAATMPPVPMVTGAAVDSDGSLIVVLDAVAVLDRADRAAVAAAEPVDALPARRVKPRILVVDDAATVRQVQHSLLTRAGYEVQTAVDGADALARLRTWSADLVLVDVEMPVMDGLTFTAALRNDPALRGIAVLILTSLGSEDDRRRGLEAGADGYLVKGTFASGRLLEAVAMLLGDDE